MTDITIQEDADAQPDAAETIATPAEDSANASLMSNKAFWAGVGIGSAALVAALMYTKRVKKKK